MNDQMLRLASAAVGHDARPTGRLKVIRRWLFVVGIMQEWRGSFGTVWISVEDEPE